MRLLLTTQVVDKNHSNLGFFHEWLKRLATQVDSLTIICLSKGEYELPPNVKVISLGKEQGSATTLTYTIRFYKALFSLRGTYDGVFVHMNPEYAFLGGPFWRLSGKKILLWYTHKAVNLRLRLGTLFATKVFTASKESFRLLSKKVEVVGHGIPVDLFSKIKWKIGDGMSGDKSKTLLLMTAGRIARSKDLKTFFAAISEMLNKKIRVEGRVYGRPVGDSDEGYKKELNEYIRSLNIPITIQDITNFYDGMPMLYQIHHIFVHTSRTGSLDKVVLEALASGRIVVSSSEVFKAAEYKNLVHSFPEGDSKELAKTIEKIYQDGILNTLPNKAAIAYVRANHNLDTLIGRIVDYFRT